MTGRRCTPTAATPRGEAHPSAGNSSCGVRPMSRRRHRSVAGSMQGGGVERSLEGGVARGPAQHEFDVADARAPGDLVDQHALLPLFQVDLEAGPVADELRGPALALRELDGHQEVVGDPVEDALGLVGVHDPEPALEERRRAHDPSTRTCSGVEGDLVAGDQAVGPKPRPGQEPTRCCLAPPSPCPYTNSTSSSRDCRRTTWARFGTPRPER